MKSLQEMDALLKELWELETRADALRKDASAAQSLAESKRAEIMQELDAQGLSSFRGSLGTVTMAQRFSVKFPKDPDVKDELKKWLVEKGAFEALWSINHQSLNAWFKQYVEWAKESGEYVDVPGLEPTSDRYLQFRKGAN